MLACSRHSRRIPSQRWARWVPLGASPRKCEADSIPSAVILQRNWQRLESGTLVWHRKMNALGYAGPLRGIRSASSKQWLANSRSPAATHMSNAWPIQGRRQHFFGRYSANSRLSAAVPQSNPGHYKAVDSEKPLPSKTWPIRGHRQCLFWAMLGQFDAIASESSEQFLANTRSSASPLLSNAWPFRGYG